MQAMFQMHTHSLRGCSTSSHCQHTLSAALGDVNDQDVIIKRNHCGEQLMRLFWCLPLGMSCVAGQ